MKKSLLFGSLAALSLAAYPGTAFGQSNSTADGNWSGAIWNPSPPADGFATGIINTVTFQSGDAWSGGTWPSGLLIGYDSWGVNWGLAGSGSGVLNVTGGTLSTGYLGLGAGNNGGTETGTLNISGGTVTADQDMLVGWSVTPGSSINVSGGTFNMAGAAAAFNVGHGAAASLNVSGTGDVNLDRSLTVKNASTVGISGGTFDIGNSGSLIVTNGSVTVNGGALTSGSGQDFIGSGSGTSGVLNISSGSFNKSGNVLFVGWGDSTGTVNQSGGNVTLGTGETLWLGNGGVGTGTYNLSGGNFTSNGLVRFGVFGSGTGIFNQSGGTAELTSVTEWGALGNYNLQGGTLKALADLGFSGAISGLHLNITGSAGNATVDTNGFNITTYNDSTFDNAAATLTKTGAGALTIAGGGAGGQLPINNGALSIQNGTLETRSSITVGNAGGTATGSISGGTLKTGYLAASNLLVGLNGTGNFTQTAGAVDIGGLANVAIGWSGTGTYNMNGGTYNAANVTYVGLFGGGVGTLNINGGSFTANAMEISAGGATSGTVNLAGPLTLTGGLSIQSGGVVNVNTGGALTTPNNVAIESGGTLKLGGGTISVNSGANFILNSGTYDINGQTVAAGSYEASPFWGPNAKLTNSSATAAVIDGAGPKNTVWINASGAIIETVGNLTIGSIVTDGGSNNGFTKTGAGTLFLTHPGNGYNGETIINAGTLSLSNPTLSDSSTVRINGGTLNLNFSGEDQVDKAYAWLGGVLFQRLAPGPWGPNDGVGITGTGYLRIAQGYDSWAADFTGPALADTTRTGDPDNDGLSNAVEYALGLDPRYSNGSPGDASNGGKTITFTKGSEAKYNDKVTYQIETSTTLGAAPTPWAVATTPVVTEDTNTISITFPAGPAKDFARLKVTLAP